MEDKTFELLEKMYGELLSLKTDVNKRFDGVEKRLDSVESEIKKLGLTVDGEIKTKIGSLYDGYTANTEKLDVVDDKVDNIQIDINNLSMKTCNNDNRIIEMNKRLKSIK